MQLIDIKTFVLQEICALTDGSNPVQPATDWGQADLQAANRAFCLIFVFL